MNLNPLKWLNWLITEHGSAAILRDHNALLKSEKEALGAKISGLELRLKNTEMERDDFKAKSESLQTQVDVLRKEIDKLNNVRVALKDQTELQNEIRRLQTANAECERLLRIKSIGF